MKTIVLSLIIVLCVGYAVAQIPEGVRLNEVQHFGCKIYEAKQPLGNELWQTVIWIETDKRYERILSFREKRKDAMKDCDKWMGTVSKQFKEQHKR